MASKYQRRQQWWTKFRHPITGTLIRGSLETTDEARAELLRQRLDLEVALGAPRFQAAEIPQRIRGALLMAKPVGETSVVATAGPAPEPNPRLISSAAAPTRTTVDQAVTAYLRYIASENAPHHVANKVSILRRFLGAARVEKVGGPALTKRRRLENGEATADPAPFFAGTYLEEITPVLVQGFLEGLGVSRKTMRHYREMFHHLFEVCLKFDLYHPTNAHRPNPISALPSYMSRNGRIVFLTQAQVDEQTAALAGEAVMQIAVALMIHAGLRRAEALWLTRDSISPDLNFLSVRNRHDHETDIESSLKTGERTVTILPPLRAALEQYLPQLTGNWVIPTPKGGRWRPDCFREALNKSGLRGGVGVLKSLARTREVLGAGGGTGGQVVGKNA